MATERGPEPGLAAGQKYFAIGLKFAGGVVVFALAGIGLDRWLKVTPLFTLIGTLGGAVLSFISVYRELAADEKRDRNRRQGPPG